jgi:hypothetical protein
MIRLVRLTMVICLSIVGHTESGAQRPPNSAMATAVADTAGAVFDIVGLWEGSFSLDSAWQLPERATARSVRVRMQFSAVGDATPATSSARSVHPGTFEIDFSRFGFTLSTSEALGWSISPDSMRAVLNPTVDHGLVEVHGRITDDAVAVGTWRYVSDPGGARGTFRLQRARTR